MNEQELQLLATQLKLDLLVLKKIYERFKPENRTDLVKVVNEITDLKNELNTQDIDRVIEFYDNSKKQEKEAQNEPVQLPNTINDQQLVVQNTQEVAEPNTDNIFQNIETVRKEVMPQVEPIIADKQVLQQPFVQSASINFENKYGQGFQFRPASQNDLTGQCAWFAQQVTRLPDGNNWTIGNSLSEKRRQLMGHKSKGNGFFKGEGQPEVGNSVILDTGTQYGHVAVISEILPDGRIRLTESNFDNDQRVRHDRIINPNDPNVVGFVKTKPTQEFQVQQPKTNPNTPDSAEKFQDRIDAPKGKQELPVEQQPVKPEDVDNQNPNAVAYEKQTGLTPEQVKQVSVTNDELNKENPNVVSIQKGFEKKLDNKNQNIGFLDVFANQLDQNNRLFKPVQEKIEEPELFKPKLPEVKPPSFSPNVNQFRQSQSTTPAQPKQGYAPQATSSSIPRITQPSSKPIQPQLKTNTNTYSVAQQAKPQIKSVAPPVRQPVVQQRPTYQPIKPVQMPARIVPQMPKLPMPSISRPSQPQNRPSIANNVKNVVNKIVSFFRR